MTIQPPRSYNSVVKHVFVENLREGARVEEVFLLGSRTVGRTRGGSPFLKMRLVDKTGGVDAIKWDATDAEIAHAAEGEHLFVHGSVRIYNGELQVTLDSFHRAPEDINPADFLPASQRDPNEMMDEFAGQLKQVQDQRLTALLAAFFDDEEFVNRFKQAPAAKSVHHAYCGGLLEHTLGVVKNSAALADLYPEVNRDLLITAAALHDVGKTQELGWATNFHYTDSGQLVGHVVTGAMMAREAADKIDGFDSLVSLAIQHAILAHHGLQEWGSPVEPKSIEALILHYADDLDAKAEIVREAIKESDRNGEDGLFTKRHRFLERSIFKGLPEPVSEPGVEQEEFDTDLFAAEVNNDPFVNE